MKIIYYILHWFNRNECEKDSFWFYGVRFCSKCKRGIEYMDYSDEKKIKKCK